MLNTLRKIVQEVNSAKDLKTALGIIVLRVKEAMGSQVCSVYLLDPETNRFVLMASEGLNKRSIGKVSMAPNEGLVGLVGTREEPLNLENAADHPRYRYFAETGEEKFASFLGAPIIHHRRVVGVLVIQQKERRQFDEGEEAFLVTMSAQLAGVIAHAEATGSIRGLGRQGKGIQEARFVGVPGSPGAAVGRAVVMLPPADLEVVPDKTVEDIDAELKLFNNALEGVRADMRKLSAKLATQLRPEERALFDVYLMMLEDAALGGEVTEVIKTGQWAQGALRQVVGEHVNRFELMDDDYLRERASDVKDLGRRLLAYLQEARSQSLVYADNTILVSEELTPAMLGEVPEGKLVGLVSVLGSGNSHVAILARAMGIPTVMGLVDLPYSKVDGIELIVDGYKGEVFTNPSDVLRKQYSEVVEEERQLAQGLDALRELPCVTLDGHRMPLWVNTGLLADVARAQQRGAEGVGLYRTEVPFMINQRFPSEKEQLAIYREQLAAFHPLPVTMRTLDIGGDKSLSYFPIKEENPFFGLARHPRHPRPPGNLPGPDPRHAQGQRGPEQPAHSAADDLWHSRTGRGAAPDPPCLGRGARRRHRRANAAGGRDGRNSGCGVPDQGTGAAGGLPVGRLQRPDSVPAGSRPQQPAGSRPVRLPAPGRVAGLEYRGARCPWGRQAGEYLRRDGR